MQDKPKTHTCFRCRTEYPAEWKLVDTREIEVFNIKKKYYDYTTKCTSCGHEWTLVESEHKDDKSGKSIKRKKT